MDLSIKPYYDPVFLPPMASATISSNNGQVK